MARPLVSPRVTVVAELIRRFTRQELSQLVTMVPVLREVQRDDAEHLAAHFRQRGRELRGEQQVELNDSFLGGLTYAQYFALSGEEQDAFWERIFVAGEDMEAMPEVDITPNADLSTR